MGGIETRSASLPEGAADVPTCEHAERCGGCPMIGLSYADQLAHKRGRVVVAVGRYPALELAYTDPVLPAEPIAGYRTRAKLMVSRSGDLGLYARGGGHEVVDIPNCRVLSPALAAVATQLRTRIRSDEQNGGPLAPVDSETGGALRAVDVREVRGGEGRPSGVFVTLVMQRAPRLDLAALRTTAEALAKENAAILGVALNVHGGDSPQVLGTETTLLHGIDSAFDRVGESMHLATFGSFVQAHRGQAERVHRLVADALGLPPRPASGSGVASGERPTRRPRVLDLYGGSGAIAMALAARGADVHMVEAFAPAVSHAARAADEQELTVTTTCADVASALRTLHGEGTRFDAIVVNPPRRGTSPTVREQLASLEPPTLVYVSCDPDTLARDLDHLARLGYRTASLKPLDMIPLTDEVESVAVLRRAPVPRAHVLFEDDEVIVVAKSAHEPTTPQGEYTGSLFARVRMSPTGADAVPLHRLDVGTSGVVMFAKHANFVSSWQAALAAPDARKIYLAAARGITPSKGSITRDLREDGKVYPARTRYRRLAVTSGHSVLRVVPEQGRTHQIRRHLAAIGHPVLGDERYGHGPTNRYFEERNGLDRTFLHCVRLEVTHPRTGLRLLVEAPVPGDLRMVLERSSGPGTLRFLDQKAALGDGGTSSIPPPPDSGHARGSAPEVDLRKTSTRPESIADDDEGLS